MPVSLLTRPSSILCWAGQLASRARRLQLDTKGVQPAAAGEALQGFGGRARGRELVGAKSEDDGGDLGGGVTPRVMLRCTTEEDGPMEVG